MEQIELIRNVIMLERRLKFEDERRKSHRFEPYVNYLAAPQPPRKKRKSIFARILQHRKESQPDYPQAPCQEMEPR